MKPRRMQRDSTNILKGKVAIVDKSTVSHARPKSRVPVKPLAGKLFYLDLPSNRKTEALENDISQLGGLVEKFFSKDIKYLVSNKKEARYVECFRLDSPAPGPDSGQNSPHSTPHQAGSHRDSLKTDTQGQVDSALTRGKSLVDRVVKEQERIQMNRTLSNALEWGVKILYVDDVIAYVEKYKKRNGHCAPSISTRVKAESKGRQGLQKFKGKRISAPFIKVEDSSRHYRPVYHTMSEMPEINLKIAPPCSPFCPGDSNHPQKKYRRHSEERGPGEAKKNRDKKRVGFCECCQVNYDNVVKHVQGDRHVAFSKSDAYLVVDRLVSTLKFNFVGIKAKPIGPIRSKCTISSILLAPGPYESPTQSHGADKKEDQHGILVPTGSGKTSTGHSLTCCSASDTVSASHSQGGTRTCDKASDHPQPKNPSFVCKESCRQDSFCVQAYEAELAWVMRPKVETLPFRGDCDIATAPKVTHANLEAHRLQTDKNALNSLNNQGDLQNEFPSNSSVVISDDHEESVKIQNSSFDSIWDEIPAGQNTTVPQCEQGNSPLKSPSPVGTIQRRVKAYKRKRRKKDTHLSQELALNQDKPDNGIPTLAYFSI